MTQSSPLSLTYVSTFDIKSEQLGLLEPSGLTFCPRTQSLWTVSDDTKRVFNLDLSGNPIAQHTFEIPVSGLEGIAIDPFGEMLLGVKEETNEILTINLENRDISNRVALTEMEGFEHIARFFDGVEENKGLEGIAWNETTGTIAVLKEGAPGLLIEVTPDLHAIVSWTQLGCSNGFSDSSLDNEAIDFSGVCHDPTRNCYWIASDRARRLFLYDPKLNSVRQSFALTYPGKTKEKSIKKAEGVVYDPDNRRLYVVSDRKAKLYVYELV